MYFTSTQRVVMDRVSITLHDVHTQMNVITRSRSHDDFRFQLRLKACNREPRTKITASVIRTKRADRTPSQWTRYGSWMVEKCQRYASGHGIRQHDCASPLSVCRDDAVPSSLGCMPTMELRSFGAKAKMVSFAESSTMQA